MRVGIAFDLFAHRAFGIDLFEKRREVGRSVKMFKGRAKARSSELGERGNIVKRGRAKDHRCRSIEAMRPC